MAEQHFYDEVPGSSEEDFHSSASQPSVDEGNDNDEDRVGTKTRVLRSGKQVDGDEHPLPKRPVGRPRKALQDEPEALGKPEKRPPGRPRKATLLEGEPGAVESMKPEKRSRGRPRKIIPEGMEPAGVPAQLEIAVDKVGAKLNEAARKDLCKLPARVDSAAAWVHNQPNVADLQAVMERFPKAQISELFTEEDRNLIGEWKQRLDPEGNTALHSLYKDCLLLLGCLPEDIICRRNGLEYDDANNRIRPSLVWSKGFCNSLKALIVHPLWASSINLLVTALQYTVITTSDDRHPWKHQTKAWDSFPSCVQRESQNGGDRRMSDIRLRVVEKHKDLPQSQWNILFERIEITAAQDRYASQAKLTEVSRDEDAPYKIHTLHLDCLIKALDSMGMGWPMFTSTHILYTGITGRRPATSYPSKDELQDLREYAILRSMELDKEHENRQKMLHSKDQEQEDSIEGYLENQDEIGDDEIGDDEIGDDEIGDAEIGDDEIGDDDERPIKRRRLSVQTAVVNNGISEGDLEATTGFSEEDELLYQDIDMLAPGTKHWGLDTLSQEVSKVPGLMVKKGSGPKISNPLR